MPTGIYRRTSEMYATRQEVSKETKQKMSIAKKNYYRMYPGKIGFKKGHQNYRIAKIIKSFCLYCKKEFVVRRYHQKYCSYLCAMKSRVGIRRPLGIGRKISIARKGIKLSILHKKNISLSLKGRSFSIETRKKMSKSRMREKHPNWKGGHYKSNGYMFIIKPDHPSATKTHYYIKRSRLMVEEQIGRYLTPKEVVHHCGEKDDDRPNMLMAFTNNGAHTRFEKSKPVKPEKIIFDGRILVTSNKKEEAKCKHSPYEAGTVC